MLIDDEFPDLTPIPEDDGPEWTEEDYMPWNDENSRIISGPLGPVNKYPGTRHASWREAKAYVEGKYRVLKFGSFAGRWIARIAR